MLIPVLEELRSQGCRISVLGLTTAEEPLKAAGFEPIGFRHLMTREDDRAQRHGIRLATEMKADGQSVPLAETIAYLGLSYADLEDRVGVSAAEQHYREQGRRVFLPLNPLRRAFDQFQPDVLLTTNSPRAEQASVIVARERNIPSISLVSLFGLQIADILADQVCIPFKATIPQLTARGVSPENLVITGHPSFDCADDVLHQESAGLAWRTRHKIEDHCLVALYAMQPGMDAQSQLIEASLEQAAILNPNLRIAVRKHPNHTEADARRVIKRFGNSALNASLETLATVLHACDLLVTHHSTVAIKAALIGRKVAFFNLDDDISAYGLPLHSYDWATFSTTIEAGSRAMATVKRESVECQQVRGAQIRQEWNCDGQSHRRIAETVLRVLKSQTASRAA
ncbi:hypothetical protein [uncultured Gimesia sp.]|uniref:hypothetical protein n=1 Tax=uncultured Gimesia sp. TaxID=1678688 RepID=UPI0030D76CEC|tara:strand:+ start:24910 stop:26103 length:1194 start_codon:yes stop_codon:yes gene_type:complete